MFRKSTSLLVVIAACLAIAALVFLVIGVETNTQDIDTWLPSGTEQRQKYDWFVDLFGHDDEIIISWEGCQTEDPRLIEFSSNLRRHIGSDGCISRVIDGRQLLDQASEAPGGFSEKQLRHRLKGFLFDSQGDSTLVVVQLSDIGRKDRRHCLDQIYDEAIATEGLNPDDLRIGGSSYIYVQIENETNNSVLLGLPAVFLATFVAFLCLRSFRLTFASLFAAGTSALSSIAMVALFGFKVNGLLVLTPVLVLVLTLSGAVHLCSYYTKALAQHVTNPVRRMLTIGWRPCALAMLTTSVGVLMLCTSHVEAVRHFGFFSALALLVALAILLTVFPSILRIWEPSRRELKRFSGSVAPLDIPIRQTPQSPFYWPAMLAIVFLIFICPFLAIGLTRISTTLRQENLFQAGSEVSRNHKWFNNKFKSFECIEVIAQFRKTADRNQMVDQLQSVARIQSSLANLEQAQSTFSLVNFCRLPSSKRPMGRVAEKSLINQRLNRDKASLIEQKLIAEDDENRYWRIRMSVELSDDVEYESLLALLENESSRFLNEADGARALVVTGIWPLSAFGRHQLFTDLATSFVLAFVIITPLIMLIMRGVVVGLIAMIPNVMPALIFFGSMGWLGLDVSVGTILTASVGLGIAVDDTLHFLEWYVQARKSGESRSAAVRSTLKQCFRPMLSTTLICGCGLIVFAASRFVPTQQFAIAIVLLLVLALVCDVVLLPLLILGPLGRFFDRPKSKGREAFAMKTAAMPMTTSAAHPINE